MCEAARLRRHGHLTLALGIGANTAIFSLVNATLLQSLPVADRARLFYILRGSGGGAFGFSIHPLYQELRDGNDTFEGLAAWGGITVSLHAGDTTELVAGAIVTGNLFDVLGVRAARGRLLTASDDVAQGAHHVAVIGHEFWRTRFGGRTDIVGRDVRLNGHVFTIVGVTPAGFPGPQLGSESDLYAPEMMQHIMWPPRGNYSGEENPDLLKNPNNVWLAAVGRLKRGVNAEHARAGLLALAKAHWQAAKRLPREAIITLVPIDEGNPDLRRQLRSVAWLLGAVVGSVFADWLCQPRELAAVTEYDTAWRARRPPRSGSKPLARGAAARDRKRILVGHWRQHRTLVRLGRDAGVRSCAPTTGRGAHRHRCCDEPARPRVLIGVVVRHRGCLWRRSGARGVAAITRSGAQRCLGRPRRAREVARCQEDSGHRRSRAFTAAVDCRWALLQS